MTWLLLLTLTASPGATRSVWYRFEDAQRLGHSVGADLWPAYTYHATEADGRHGHGLRLDGTAANGLYLPNPVSFFGEEARAGTIALWVQPSAGPQEGLRPQVLFDFMRQTGNTLIDGYEICLFTDGLQLKAKPCLDRQMAVDNPLRPGVWTHLALTWDCDQGTAFYVDGEQVAERTGAFQPTALEAGWPGRIGCHTPSGGYPFAGSIDELRLLDRRLRDDEVRSLLTLDLADAPQADTVREQRWLPSRHVAPPWRGYLPLPFAAAGPETTYLTVGAVPVETVGEARRITAGAAAPPLPDELGPCEARLLAGEGLGAQEVADRRSAGLELRPAAFTPLVMAAGRAREVVLQASNGLGRAFQGELSGELQSHDGKRVAMARSALILAAGKECEVRLTWPSEPPAGTYELAVSAVEQGRTTPLERTPLFVVAPGDAATMTDVAAAYVHPVGDEATLAAMARDGVTAVRLHGGGGDFYNAGKSLAAVLQYGLKAWRMPAASYRSVCVDPAKRAELRRTGQHLGAYLRDNPAVIDQVIAGEGLSCPPCYCGACTMAFQSWLREQYGSLERVNQAWGTDDHDWSEIEQLGSPADLDETAERLKMMKVALELPADNRARWQRLYELDPPRALDWKRWHESKFITWYADFAAAFHETNQGCTPLSEQPCWPSFESHVLFALGRIGDLGGMDLYLPGEGPTTLGYPAELCLNFDLNASIFASRGKPLMVHELYLQDNSPELLPEAQGWWLVGRGYGLLTYFTYDHYKEGVRNNLPLIFGLFGEDGTPYPCYPSFQRFSREVKRLAQRYPAATLRRERPRVALFMGDEMSLVNNLSTGGATWEAAGVHGHNGAYWLTERSGDSVEFVNDDGLANLRQSVLVVPWSPVVRDASLERIVEFAQRGGTVIVDGALGLFDEHHVAYDPLPGGRALAPLGLKMQGYAATPNRLVTATGVALAAHGVASGVELAQGRVLLHDAEGRPGLVELPVGRGKVLWLLAGLGRDNLGRAPEAGALTLWRATLAEQAGVEPRWRVEAEPTVDAAGKPAVFDVSFRLRGDRECLVFLTSFFAPTRGELTLHLPPASYQAEEALSGAAVELKDGRLAVDLPAYGSRVLRLRATAGRPFADW